MYPVTATLSVEASQLKVNEVEVLPDAARPVGVVGAVVSFALVVTGKELDAAILPAASRALTTIVYVVDGVRPTMLIEVVVVVPKNEPFK
jgi:hypothetical protein